MCPRHYAAWRKATPPDERRVTTEDRFWVKVNKQGPPPAHLPSLGSCWLWTASTTDWGYGKLRAQSRWCTAHRRSYEMAYGAIPEGLFVCHRCDTPACVRPDHLFLGTPQQNTQDMHLKGRAGATGSSGARNPCAALTDDQVLAIRQRFEDGELIADMAVEFNVHRASISSIVNGRTWKHLGGPIRLPGQIGRRARKAA
ncbi:HNH endonuclease [Streptomyces sp. NPDC047737]|uniref:HNH endonuclease n=1 Tax=Streptomyces sp. NPDC047737 TaxID=3155740 RepID=UPI0033E26647